MGLSARAWPPVALWDRARLAPLGTELPSPAELLLKTTVLCFRRFLTCRGLKDQCWALKPVAQVVRDRVPGLSERIQTMCRALACHEATRARG